VERVADGGMCRTTCPSNGHRYDAQRLGGAALESKSHLPIRWQARLIGATRLEPQSTGGGSGLIDLGFDAEVRPVRPCSRARIPGSNRG
jgi:hypothetical protein